MNSGRSNHLSNGELHELREQLGYRRKDSKEKWETRPASLQQQGSSRAQVVRGNMDIPAKGNAKRGRPPADAAECSRGPAVFSGQAS